MTRIVVPQKFDDALNLEVDEEAYIICESKTPTKIIFTRGSIRNREIAHISKVENWKHKQNFLSKKYAIVKAPSKLVPNQKVCEKTMCVESDDGDFIIVIK